MNTLLFCVNQRRRTKKFDQRRNDKDAMVNLFFHEMQTPGAYSDFASLEGETFIERTHKLFKRAEPNFEHLSVESKQRVVSQLAEAVRDVLKPSNRHIGWFYISFRGCSKFQFEDLREEKTEVVLAKYREMHEAGDEEMVVFSENESKDDREKLLECQQGTAASGSSTVVINGRLDDNNHPKGSMQQSYTDGLQALSEVVEPIQKSNSNYKKQRKRSSSWAAMSMTQPLLWDDSSEEEASSVRTIFGRK